MMAQSNINNVDPNSTENCSTPFKVLYFFSFSFHKSQNPIHIHEEHQNVKTRRKKINRK